MTDAAPALCVHCQAPVQGRSPAAVVPAGTVGGVVGAGVRGARGGLGSCRMTGQQTPEQRYTELMGYPLCAHCGAKWPVREVLFDRRPGAPWQMTTVYLCRRPGPLSPPDTQRCAELVLDWGHPAPCVDCAGLVGPEDGWPGLAWLAATCGVGVDDVMEAVTWM